MNELIIGLNLSVLFAFSILTIVLIGIIISEYIRTKNLEFRSIQRNSLFLFILLEIVFISGVLAYSNIKYFSIINLVMFLITFVYYLIVILRFWKLLDKRFIFLNLLFGTVTMIGICWKFFMELVLGHTGHIIHLIGIIGLTIFAPLSAIKLIIDNSGGKGR